MTSVRRTARILAGAALLVAVPVLAGCGTERVSDSPPAAGRPSPAGPTPYGEEGPGDTNPHYAENHAFQSTLDLSPADRAKGDTEVARVRTGLAGIADGRKSDATRIRAALTALGYAPETITTRALPPHGVTFVLALGTICVDGSLDGTAGGRVTAEAHGRYMEGTGCVKPQGGH
ncbi:hypothetical protein ABZ454_26640 [Streptomyces sp. NPDC005803]|uniref:hypothetical protein n=1 Tax=Streptomyces sp. NPDC005803 TaxID=3154297 RepID=UPI0033E306F7